MNNKDKEQLKKQVFDVIDKVISKKINFIEDKYTRITGSMIITYLIASENNLKAEMEKVFA